MTSEIRPNKTSLQYQYYNGTGYIKNIEVQNSKGEQRQAISFNYEKLPHDNGLITIASNDGRKVCYTVETFTYKVGMQKRWRFFVKEVL